MNLAFLLGTTGLSDVGYRFLDATGAFTGSRITSGVYEFAGARGCYGVSNPTFPAGSIAVYWDSTGTASAYGYEFFDFRLPNNDTSSAGAVLTAGTGTAQLSVGSGLVSLGSTQAFSNTGTWTGNIVGTLSTLTTYTGNTPQTGDSFARIGATGSGLTSLAPSSTALSTAEWTGTIAGRIDAAVSSRMATFTYTEPDNTTLGTIATEIAKVPRTGTTHTHTNTVTAETASVAIT